MIIKKLKEKLGISQKYETQTTILEKKAGTFKLECSVDDDIVDCNTFKESPYTGVPAPAYLEDDNWFGSAPVKSEKQLNYMEQEVQIKQQEQTCNPTSTSIEPEDIHQRMYEIATKNQNTTLDLDPVGGSENFQSGPGGWMSGNGMRQFNV